MKTTLRALILSAPFLFGGTAFGEAPGKETLVDQVIQASADALTPEALEELSKALPNPFQGKFGNDQKKFDEIYLKHSKDLAKALQSRQMVVMQKVLKPVYLENYSEEELKGILDMNKLPVTIKMKNSTPGMMKASAETTQKFMMFFGRGAGLSKVMELSLKEAREKGLNQEALDKAVEIFKENTKDLDHAALEKDLGVGIAVADAKMDPAKKDIIDKLLDKQLNDQLQPLFDGLLGAIPNKFDAQFGADQNKFNDIFEKNRKALIEDFKSKFLAKMRSIMLAQYEKTFSIAELSELLKLQDGPLTKKQLEVNKKVAAMAPVFAQAQAEIQDHSEMAVYLKIFEEAEKAGMNSPEFKQVLEGLRMKAPK